MSSDDEVPEGWASCTIRDIAQISYGKGLKAANRSLGSVPVYGSNGVVGHHDTGLTHGPAIILGRKGSVGAIHYSPVACWPIDTTYFIDQFEATDTRYFTHLLRSLNLAELDTSTAIPGLNRDDVYRKAITLPPLAEQRRIVAKVEELLARVTAARDRLRRVPVIVKRFRQAVLAAACSGRLTEDWRSGESGSASGASLLAEILERRRDIAENQRAGRYRAPSVEVPEDLPELPEEWAWATVESLSTKVVDGVHKTPVYVDRGIPFVTVRNLTAGLGIDLDRLNYVSPDDHQKFIQRANPEAGDILVSKDGTLGVVRAVRTEQPFSIFVSVALIKPVLREMTDYLELALSSPVVQRQMTGTGSGLQHIHLRDLRADCVPLPSLVEQRAIGHQVEALFQLADAIERRVAAATLRAEKLTQAILAKAFRGELVPTEAELARREGRDYEPASALLERIRAAGQ